MRIDQLIRALALASIGMLAATTGSASDGAGSSPEAVIEARQQGFKKMGAAMKALTGQLKSDAPDHAQMAAAVQTLSAGADAQLHWFPAGSGPESGLDTDALPTSGRIARSSTPWRTG